MIRERVPDKFKAQSMLKAAEIEINFLKTLKPSKETGQTIIRGIYEDFRMLGDALLLIRGKEASDIDHHNDMINELFNITVKTSRPVQSLLNLKTLRHKINYKGYLPSIEEINDTIGLMESLFKPLLDAIIKEKERL